MPITFCKKLHGGSQIGWVRPQKSETGVPGEIDSRRRQMASQYLQQLHHANKRLADANRRGRSRSHGDVIPSMQEDEDSSFLSAPNAPSVRPVSGGGALEKRIQIERRRRIEGRNFVIRHFVQIVEFTVKSTLELDQRAFHAAATRSGCFNPKENQRSYSM